MEWENSKGDLEEAAIKESKNSPGSQMNKVFYERENDQVY